MIPPTSIDGTDITGATIDGTDVEEITVDGDVVFSAQQLPVAYSNLVAWYPFDSAEYGGSNADDVTAIIGGSGDDTAYDGTVNGANYQSSGGVTDINAGSNSGGFDFSGDDTIGIPDATTSQMSPNGSFSITFWINPDSLSNYEYVMDLKADFDYKVAIRNSSSIAFEEFTGSTENDVSTSIGTSYKFIAITYNNKSVKMYGNSGSPEDTATFQGAAGRSQSQFIGGQQDSQRYIDGTMDDIRFYDKELSQSEVDQIYTNTQ